MNQDSECSEIQLDFTIREEDLLISSEGEDDLVVDLDQVYNSDDDLEELSSFPDGVCSSQESSLEPGLNSSAEDRTLPTTSTASGSGKRKYNQKELSRKRQCNPEGWEKNVQKMNVSLGLPYTSILTKKAVPARTIKRSCGPGCRMKCDERILGNDGRTIMFKELWSIRQQAQKYEYLLRYVSEQPSKSGSDNSRRTLTREYTIKTLNNKTIKVCQSMFINTLGISIQMVKTALEKRRNGDVVLADKRGSSQKSRSREIAVDQVEGVIKHINLFPRVESHYLRSKTSREYLDESLNINRMYILYCAWAIENGIEAVKDHAYRDIFNSRFNLSFFKPKKDQCDQCVGYKNASEQEKTLLSLDYQEHLYNKETSRDLKSKDAEIAKKDKAKVMACFDFQKVLATPRAESSCLYYKRKLSVFNLTVYDVGSHKAYCYVWNESEAGRGSNEVGSCLLHFFGEKVTEGANDFSLYSDNCPGQNKNKAVLSSCAYACSKYKVPVKYTFLQQGHTQNEGDSVHANIERHAKNREVFTPEGWCDIIRDAKITGTPYEVIHVTHDKILDFKDLSSRLNWTVTTTTKLANGKTKNKTDSIPISKLKQVLVFPEEPNILKFKTSFADEFSTLVLRKNKNHVNMNKYTLKNAYKSDQGITAEKWDDLDSLCKSNIIKPQYHEFYRSLPVKLIRKKSRSSKRADESEEL